MAWQSGGTLLQLALDHDDGRAETAIPADSGSTIEDDNLAQRLLLPLPDRATPGPQPQKAKASSENKPEKIMKPQRPPRRAN